MNLLDFIELSNKCSSEDELFALLEKAAENIGFDRIAYGRLPISSNTLKEQESNRGLLLNFPQKWVDCYFDRGYYAIDPVIIYSHHIGGPYMWDQLSRMFKLSPRQRAMLEEAKDVGLMNGISVPLHGPLGRIAVMSFASSCPMAYPEAHMGLLQAMAVQFHSTYDQIVKRMPSQPCGVALPQREKECLRWVADGKSSWSIGMILGVSENTVNYHIKNALKKLDTNSRIVAAVKAVNYGLADA